MKCNECNPDGDECCDKPATQRCTQDKAAVGTYVCDEHACPDCEPLTPTLKAN